MNHDTYAHEIGNALNAICGLSELMQQSDNVDDLKTYANLINKSANLARTIQDDYKFCRKNNKLLLERK